MDITMIAKSSELSTRLDGDKLNMFSRDRAAALAHTSLDAMRNEGAEAHLAGIAVAFAALAHRYQMGPEQLYLYGLRILESPGAHHRNGNALIESLRDFANLKVRNDPAI